MSQAGSSEAPEEGEGLVYFIETEPEEIFQVADHQTTQEAEPAAQDGNAGANGSGEVFVFQDHNDGDGESEMIMAEPSIPANNSIQNESQNNTEVEVVTRLGT